MNLPPITEAPSIRELIRQLASWRDVLNNLGAPLLSRGVVVTKTLVAGQNVLQHGLRTKPRGWVVLRAQGSSPGAFSEESSDETTLTLNSTAQVTVDVWVYS